MRRQQAIERLSANAGELRALGVGALWLFGSTARGTSRVQSDVDLYFESADPRLSLVELVALQRRLGEMLSARVDVMTRDSLHPALRAGIESSAVRIF